MDTSSSINVVPLPQTEPNIHAKPFASTSMPNFSEPYHAECGDELKSNNSCDWHNALGDFLFGCNIPFDVVESEHFRNFIETMRPVSSSQLPDHKAVASSVLSSAYDRTLLQRAALSSTKESKSSVLVFESWMETINECEKRCTVCTLQTGLSRNGIEFIGAWETLTTDFQPDILKEAIKKAGKHPNGSSMYATLSASTCDFTETVRQHKQLWQFTCARSAAEKLLSDCMQTDLVTRVGLVLNAFKVYAKDLRSLGGSGLFTVEPTKPKSLPAALDCLTSNIDMLRNLASAKNMTDDRVLISLRSVQFMECVRECRHFVRALYEICGLVSRASIADSVRLWLSLKPPNLIDRNLNTAYQNCMREMLSVHAITAFYLHPQMNRELLSTEQQDQVQEWLLIQLNSSGLDDLYAFQIGSGIFEILNAKQLKHPIVFWTMAKRKHSQLAELAIKLLQVPAVVGRHDFGASYVHSRSRNGLELDQWKRLLYVYYDRRSSDGNETGDY